MARKKRPRHKPESPSIAADSASPTSLGGARTPDGAPSWARRGLLLLWGCLLAAWLARAFFAYPVDTIHHTHEKHTYPPRLVEFRDALGHGFLSPQWCPHFWGGLGSPYFSYYQPGFFYAACLAPWMVPTVPALGVTVFGFALAGYWGMFCFVRRLFGWEQGALSATALLLSVYVGTNIYVRGDFTEFAGMMLVPVAFAAMGAFLAEPTRAKAAGVALAGGGLVVTHPCVALMAYPLLAAAAAVWGLAWAGWRRGLGVIGALILGGLLASFYAWPALFETGFTYSERAFTNFYDFRRNFLTWDKFVGNYQPDQQPIPTTLGIALPLVACVNLLVLAVNWQRTTAPQRSCLLFFAVAAVVSLFLMTAGSQPIWEALPLLHRLQFPWRFLAITTVMLSAQAGMVLPGKPAWAVRGLMLAVVAWLGMESQAATPLKPLDPPRPIAETVEDLLRNTFIPDANFEWLPKTAQPLIPDSVNLADFVPPGCQVDEFHVEQGRVSAQVRFAAGGLVALRHFYFIEGWQATFNGQPIELQPNPQGLMQVRVPRAADGLLEVRFHGTPMRRWGWYATLVACLPLALLLAPKRWNARVAGAEQREPPAALSKG